LCPYSGTSTATIQNENVKQDDRELNKNIDKTLRGTSGETCGGNSSKKITNPVDQNTACRDANPNAPLAANTNQCEFYCPNGWHKEGTSLANRKCVANSCGYDTQLHTEGGYSMTFELGCVDHGKPTPDSVKPQRTTDGHGTITFTRKYSACSYGGTRSITSTTYSVSCDL
jgi:hypothetical protein